MKQLVHKRQVDKVISVEVSWSMWVEEKLRVQKTKAGRAQKITEYLQAEDCTETELQRFEKVPHKVHTRKENTRGWGKNMQKD